MQPKCKWIDSIKSHFIINWWKLNCPSRTNGRTRIKFNVNFYQIQRCSQSVVWSYHLKFCYIYLENCVYSFDSHVSKRQFLYKSVYVFKHWPTYFILNRILLYELPAIVGCSILNVVFLNFIKKVKSYKTEITCKLNIFS